MPSTARNVSSIRKLPLNSRAGFWKISHAASARISGVREARMIASPPSRFLIAAVAIVVRGQSALTAMPRARNSPAKPSTQRLIPYFAIE